MGIQGNWTPEDLQIMLRHGNAARMVQHDSKDARIAAHCCEALWHRTNIQERAMALSDLAFFGSDVPFGDRYQAALAIARGITRDLDRDRDRIAYGSALTGSLTVSMASLAVRMGKL
jgi:hypothetical protein